MRAPASSIHARHSGKHPGDSIASGSGRFCRSRRTFVKISAAFAIGALAAVAIPLDSSPPQLATACRAEARVSLAVRGASDLRSNALVHRDQGSVPLPSQLVNFSSLDWVQLVRELDRQGVEVKPDQDGMIAVSVIRASNADATTAANLAAQRLVSVIRESAKARLSGLVEQLNAKRSEMERSGPAVSVDVQILLVDRSGLAIRLDRLRSLKKTAQDEAIRLASDATRASNQLTGETLLLLEKERSKRLSDSKGNDALLAAAIAEQTASAREYWGELGAGKTESHREVILAHRRLETASKAVGSRERELAIKVESELEGVQSASLRRQADEARSVQEAAERRLRELNNQVTSLERDLETADRQIDTAKVAERTRQESAAVLLEAEAKVDREKRLQDGEGKSLSIQWAKSRPDQSAANPQFLDFAPSRVLFSIAGGTVAALMCLLWSGNTRRRRRPM